MLLLRLLSPLPWAAVLSGAAKVTCFCAAAAGAAMSLRLGAALQSMRRDLEQQAAASHTNTLQKGTGSKLRNAAGASRSERALPP